MSKDNWDIIRAKYVASAVRADQYPQPSLIEAAFIGRSNVGKSIHSAAATAWHA
jgi:GTP-binding protein